LLTSINLMRGVAMRSALLFLAVFSLCPVAATAQSIGDNIPQVVIEGQASPPAAPPLAANTQPAASVIPADPYMFADINADVTADNAAHARDKALLQAQRTAYSQLCARMGVADDATNMSDDAIAMLVQSFEVQSEKVSAVRYIGVFTIRFKPAAVQKKLGGVPYKPALQGPFEHVKLAVRTNTLAEWTALRKRLAAVRQVAQIDTLNMGRGLSHIDVSFAGGIDELRQEVSSQGFVMQQNEAGEWDLIDVGYSQ